MQKLLDALEQYGFKDPEGHLLTNCLEWHDLRRRLAHGVLLETADVVQSTITFGRKSMRAAIEARLPIGMDYSLDEVRINEFVLKTWPVLDDLTRQRLREVIPVAGRVSYGGDPL